MLDNLFQEVEHSKAMEERLCDIVVEAFIIANNVNNKCSSTPSIRAELETENAMP